MSKQVLPVGHSEAPSVAFNQRFEAVAQIEMLKHPLTAEVRQALGQWPIVHQSGDGRDQLSRLFGDISSPVCSS